MRVLFSTLLGFLVYMDQILWSGEFIDKGLELDSLRLYLQ